MIRRLSIAAVALAAVATLSACSAVPDRNAVATVGDETLTQDDLDEILASPLTQQLLQIPPGVDRYPMADVRDVLGTWITVNNSAVQDLPEASDDDVTASFGEEWTTAPQPLQDLLRNISRLSLGAASQAITQAELSEAAADGTVASRFGRWDPAQLIVVPLGQ